MHKIKLFFWNKANFGDALSPYIISKLTDNEIKFKKPYKGFVDLSRQIWTCIKLKKLHEIKHLTLPFEHVIFSIGSILSNSYHNSIVWGSGFMNKDEKFVGGKILALRGKYSNEKLKDMGFEGCDIFGDPALLSPIVFSKKVEKTNKIGIIPHWKDTEFFLTNYSKMYKIIDLRTTDIESVICEILSCKYILSTSLHGIIVSHAYGIPALWMEKGYIDTDGFKFNDYFRSVGISPYTAFKKYDEILSEDFNIENFFELNKECALPNVSIRDIQKSLLSVAPFKIKEKYKLC